MLLLQRNDAQIHQRLCLEELIAAETDPRQAGLQHPLCVVEFSFLDINNPLGAGDLRAQSSLRALALRLQHNFFRSVKISEPSLRDRAKDLTIHFEFRCGTSRKGLLKDIQ